MPIASQKAFTPDVQQARLQVLLPEVYRDCFLNVQPISMGSAALKLDAEGFVAWDEIWGSFCDLAIAGGPPHRGTLLEPGSESDIEAQSDRHQVVVKEICRGISLVSDLLAEESYDPGWVRVSCETVAMARWLALSICSENVSARSDGLFLSLPAGPTYRVEKEIKNVITAFAKTSHYWLDHTSLTQRQLIANLFVRMDLDSALIFPESKHRAIPLQRGRSSLNRDSFAEHISKSIQRLTGLSSSDHCYMGWLGIDCQNVGVAISMMRLLIVANLFSRREGTVVFLPLNPQIDPSGERVIHTLHEVFMAMGSSRLHD